MKILQLHNHHEGKGGAMEVLAHELEMLAAAGHDVQQLTVPAASELALSGLRAGAKAVWNRDAAAELDRVLTAFEPDVVHVHTPFPIMSPAVFRVAHKRGVPAVTTLHSFRYSCVAGTCFRDGKVCEDCVGTKLKLSGVRHRCYHDSRAASAALTAGLVLHRTIGTFDRCVTRYLALTAFSRDLLIRDGIAPDQVVVKPNSVPDPGFVPHPSQAERRLVFVGRLIDVKGVQTLLDAWARVPAGMRLTIAGDGPLRPLVEQRAQNDPSIDFRGWVDEDEVFDLMGQAEAVLVPSEWYEGGPPLVVLRSLAVGTPVVVSDLENICADIVRDGSGWTFRVGDPQSLAETLCLLHADPSLAQSRRAVARDAYVERYSEEVDLKRLEEIYRNAIRD